MRLRFTVVIRVPTKDPIIITTCNPTRAGLATPLLLLTRLTPLRRQGVLALAAIIPPRRARTTTRARSVLPTALEEPSTSRIRRAPLSKTPTRVPSDTRLPPDPTSHATSSTTSTGALIPSLPLAIITTIRTTDRKKSAQLRGAITRIGLRLGPLRLKPTWLEAKPKPTRTCRRVLRQLLPRSRNTGPRIRTVGGAAPLGTTKVCAQRGVSSAINTTPRLTISRVEALPVGPKANGVVIMVSTAFHKARKDCVVRNTEKNSVLR